MEDAKEIPATVMPPLGKRRLRVMLAREGTALSESAVGRILAKGLRLGRIRPCAFLRGRAKAKRRRGFAKGHAVPWRRHMKARRPGEWLQIDHTGVSRDGATLKEFRATCPLGKQMVARAYSRATANNARRFLEAVLEDLPYPPRSIQVDGGGEHATPGRMKVTFSSSNSAPTRTDFPITITIPGQSEHRSGPAFSDWEWRIRGGGGTWRSVGNTGLMNFFGGDLGENIIEVRPKAGAHIWSNRNPSNTQQGPGEMVMQILDVETGSTTPYQSPGEACFFFMGGKGCARVNAWGETDGSIQ